jgi:Domain of unknown function (DUF4926)
VNPIANINLHELDIVVLTHDIPEHNLRQGNRGAIVHCYSNSEAFEVEFIDSDGHTLALLTLTPSDLQPSPTPSTPDPAHV